jgi:hypothetical protein
VRWKVEGLDYAHRPFEVALLDRQSQCTSISLHRIGGKFGVFVCFHYDTAAVNRFNRQKCRVSKFEQSRDDG